MDTAASWWRNQTLTSALIDATNSSFKDWANDRSIRVVGQETTHKKIYSVLLSTSLTGDHGTWRTISSVLARHTLVTAHQSGDNSSYADALDELRRSGDSDLLNLAVKRLWATGPVDPLATAASRVQQHSWTHTSARANLALLHGAGDVLDETTASSAARRCLEILADNTAFVAATNPSFDIPIYVARALSGLVRAADDQVHRDIAGSFADWSHTDDERATALAGVAGKLRASALSDEDRAALRGAATRHDRPLANAILGALADHDVLARAQLLANIAEGDAAALPALGRPRYLSAHLAQQEISRLAHDLDDAITQAIGGRFRVRGIDSGRNLALLNISFPDAALWDPIVRLLAEQRVPGEQKRDACLFVARHIRRVPDSIQAAVRNVAQKLVDQAPVDRLLGPPVRGPAIALAATVGALDAADLDTYLAELLTGQRSHERADAALVIAVLDHGRYTAALTTLAGDSHIAVRTAAAFALAMHVAKDESNLDQLAWSGLQQVLAQPGISASLEVCRGFAAVDVPADRACQITRRFLHHQSAAVRHAATEASSGHSQLPEAVNRTSPAPLDSGVAAGNGPPGGREVATHHDPPWLRHL